jgi:hypothetical protein
MQTRGLARIAAMTPREVALLPILEAEVKPVAHRPGGPGSGGSPGGPTGAGSRDERRHSRRMRSSFPYGLD